MMRETVTMTAMSGRGRMTARSIATARATSGTLPSSPWYGGGPAAPALTPSGPAAPARPAATLPVLAQPAPDEAERGEPAAVPARHRGRLGVYLAAAVLAAGAGAGLTFLIAGHGTKAPASIAARDLPAPRQAAAAPRRTGPRSTRPRWSGRSSQPWSTSPPR